jgi:hypothetical protein
VKARGFPKAGVPKSSQPSVGRDAWQMICHFGGKSLREKRECGTRTPEGRRAGVHLSRPSTEDRCQ